jgi:hypothetical protein
VTRGRGVELEREIAAVERRLSERVAKAEARAEAAEERANQIFEALIGALRKPPSTKGT